MQIGRKFMNKKSKINLIRAQMREQSPKDRTKTFQEVALGYTDEIAMFEASRCLQCKKPFCITGCPVNIKIPEFIKLISEGDFAGAAAKIKETHAFPAVCGRVCPQERQCEEKCVLNNKGVAVAIGNLERFASDWEQQHVKESPLKSRSKNNRKVGIVGSGPAGLAAARELIVAGFDVTIFEALHEAGGVLMYGIPEFRLPKEIVQHEISSLEKAGVVILKDFIVGKTATIDELMQEENFEAIFIGAGAGLPLFMHIPGENSIGVYSANEYLTRSNLMKAYLSEATTPIIRGKKVVTVGGGNVAMDSARTALRLGAEKSIIVYRRTEKEMPARIAEVHHAKEENIDFHLLCNPIEILANEKGFVKGIRCIRMQLGDPDASGRQKPIPIKNSEFELDCDVVIIAIGNKPNPIIGRTTSDIKLSSRGTIIIDEQTGKTSKPLVYAGGDIVTGAATVILAMGAGKQAGKSIVRDLLGETS